MDSNKQKLEKERVILVEGKDAERFFICSLNKYQIDDVQIIDFGGVNQLQNAIGVLVNDSRYDQLKTVVIARDAEKDHNSAIQSIQSSLEKHHLPVPSF